MAAGREGSWRSGRGRSCWTSSSSRARPSSGTSIGWARPRSSARRCRSATCPTCSATSPRCRSSCGEPGSARRRLARRARGGRPARGSAGRPPTAPGSGPSTWSAATATRPTCSPTRTGRVEAGRLPDQARAVLGDARSSPCTAPTTRSPPRLADVVDAVNAGEDGSRSARDAGRLRPPRARVDGQPSPLDRGAAVRRAGEHADGRHLGPGRSRERPAGASSGCSSVTPSRWRRSTAPAGRSASSSSAGGGSSTTRPTTRSPAARTTRWSTRSSAGYEADQIGRGSLDEPDGRSRLRRAARELARRQPVADDPDGRGHVRCIRARPAASSPLGGRNGRGHPGDPAPIR